MNRIHIFTKFITNKLTYYWKYAKKNVFYTRLNKTFVLTGDTDYLIRLLCNKMCMKSVIYLPFTHLSCLSQFSLSTHLPTNKIYVILSFLNILCKLSKYALIIENYVNYAIYLCRFFSTSVHCGASCCKRLNVWTWARRVWL